MFDPLTPPLSELKARRSAKWATYPGDVLPAWVAEMDFTLAPAVTEALHAAVGRSDLGYVEARYEALRESFVGFTDRRLRWSVDPARVTLVPDVMVGVAEMLRVLLEPGQGVVVTPPVYPPFFSTVDEVGNRLVEVPLTSDGHLDLDGIDGAFAAGARALLLCNPHNPTGCAPSRTELEALADMAAIHRAWVLADEIHGPLTLPGATHVPFLTVSPAAAEYGVALTSASKAFNLPGLKAGLVVTASDAMSDHVGRLPVELHERAGLLGVLASEAAFAEGDSWLDHVLAVLDDNRQLLGTLLADHLPDIGYRPPQASYLAWLDCRSFGLGPDPAEVILDEGRLAVSRGLDFGTPGAGFVRLNIGTSSELIEEAIRRMKAALLPRGRR